MTANPGEKVHRFLGVQDITFWVNFLIGNPGVDSPLLDVKHYSLYDSTFWHTLYQTHHPNPCLITTGRYIAEANASNICKCIYSSPIYLCPLCVFFYLSIYISPGLLLPPPPLVIVREPWLDKTLLISSKTKIISSSPIHFHIWPKDLFWKEYFAVACIFNMSGFLYSLNKKISTNGYTSITGCPWYKPLRNCLNSLNCPRLGIRLRDDNLIVFTVKCTVCIDRVIR